ncbi:hypothetical protein H5410_003051 [Solanum commersonii]|uniref:Uncharacterized protein n=1 Tax=Solanum commersonii TaxID=4109 RepID=A0A9J6B3N0_SOLCO|nr:hypothetical protein H5410_003051 [Solanum commersonii]
MSKVKVQVDLTKARPRHVWISLDDEDLTIGRWQPIKYEISTLTEHNSKEGTTPHGAQSRSKADHNQRAQVKQTGNKVNNKSTCIDSMLPIPIDLNISYLDGAIEVEGGMDGGCQ